MLQNLVPQDQFQPFPTKCFTKHMVVARRSDHDLVYVSSPERGVVRAFHSVVRRRAGAASLVTHRTSFQSHAVESEISLSNWGAPSVQSMAVVGSVVAIAHGNRVSLFHCKSGLHLGSWEPNGTHALVSLCRRGGKLYSLSRDGSVSIWNVEEGSVDQVALLENLVPGGTALYAPGTFAAMTVAGAFRKICVINAQVRPVDTETGTHTAHSHASSLTLTKRLEPLGGARAAGGA